MRIRSILSAALFVCLPVLTQADMVNTHHFPSPLEMGYQKPGADIKIVNASIQKLDLAALNDFALGLSASKNTGILDVEIKPDSGLEIIGAADKHSFDLVESNTIEIPMQLSTSEEGQYFLHVFVTHTDEYGEVTTRATALAFRTPRAEELIKAKRKSRKASNGVISLPAKEVIY